MAAPSIAVPETTESVGLSYKDLTAIADKFLHGTDDLTSGDVVQEIFRSTVVLPKHTIFQSVESVAQLLIEGKIELAPNTDRLPGQRHIIPIKNEDGSICLLFSPENSDGVESALQFSLDVGDSLTHLVNGGAKNTDIVLLTSEDYAEIRAFFDDPDKPKKARDFLSYFDESDGDGVKRLVESMLTRARRLGASDLHVQPRLDSYQILIRLHGMLQPMPNMARKLTQKTGQAIAIVLSNFAGEQLQSGSPLDGAFRFVSKGTDTANHGNTKIVTVDNPTLYDTDYRLSLLPLSKGGGYSAVVRLLMKPGGLKSLGELGYDTESVKEFEEVGDLGFGLTIISGPTGSGKTTTLYALLGSIHDPSKKTITVENPVELRVDGIVQSEVNEAKNYTFPQAMRRILRHDPDQVLIGETRDSETAKTAIEAANTGHTVLTTIHANTAAESVRRLRNLGIDPLDIAASVQFLFTQRLVPELDPSDAFVEWYDGTPELSKILGVRIEGPIYIRRPTNSEHGIIGRIPIYERIQMTSKLRRKIEADPNVTTTDIEAIAIDEGFTPMEIYGLKQVLLGRTSFDGLKRFINPSRVREYGEKALEIITAHGKREIPTAEVA